MRPQGSRPLVTSQHIDEVVARTGLAQDSLHASPEIPTSMNSQDVLQYLRDHPEFFEEHAELLTQVSIPHPHGGPAIPLSERQVLALRDRNRALQGKLSELIQFGEENDTIGERVHRLSLALLGASDRDAAIRETIRSLREDFALTHVAIRLWRGSGDAAEYMPVSAAIHDYAATLELPFCGPNDRFEAAEWFGVDPTQIQSVALCALRDDAGVFGMLALGAEDPKRFFPEMGTLYLTRIAELISASLGQTQ